MPASRWRSILQLHAALLLCLLLAAAGCEPLAKTRNLFRKRGGRTTASGQKDAREGRRVYIVIEQNGERRSSGYQVRRHSTYRRHPCILLERVRHQALERGGRIYKKTIQQKTITATDGAALYASTVTIAGGERYQESTTISKGKAVFETVTPSGTRRSTVAVPRGVMFGIEPSWLVLQDLKVGREFKARVLDRSRKRVVTERVTIRGHRREQVLGREEDVWEAESVRPGSSPVRMVFTASGDIVRLYADDIVFRVVPKQELARKSVPAARIVSHVNTDFTLHAWDTYGSMVVEPSPAAAWSKYVRDSDYMQVNQRDGRLVLTLRKKLLAPIKATLPLQIPRHLQPYLAAAPTIMPGKRRIRETARSIVRSEKNALMAVALLAGWVHQSIRFGNRRSLNSDPISTLEDRAGDCTEHADLFASLARSQGIPTRHCLGLVLRMHRAVYHCWTEVWIGGTWIPVDTTVNRVGLPAGYILTSRGTGQGIPRDEFAWRMRKGDLKLHFVSATREFFGHNPHTMVAGDKKTYVAGEGNWFTNLLWGFSLELPKGWKGLVKLNYVELTSRDTELPAMVKCEGIGHEYPARESTLDRIVAGLKKKFADYRTLEARLIHLPTGPRLPGRKRRTSLALFVDFTCRNGKNTLRCRQYIIPKRDRSYRIWMAAVADKFPRLAPYFRSILDSLEL